jgi:hypothetical protein
MAAPWLGFHKWGISPLTVYFASFNTCGHYIPTKKLHGIFKSNFGLCSVQGRQTTKSLKYCSIHQHANSQESHRIQVFNGLIQAYQCFIKQLHPSWLHHKILAKIETI